MRFMSIASGSSGNCIYTGNEKDHVLIDVGISKKRIEEGLNTADMSLADINGILITHEHSDHIKALGVVLRKYDIPVYAAKETIETIFKEDKLGKINRDVFHAINPDESWNVNSLMINPFNVPHDAAHPLAYKVSDGEKSVAVATDMGCYDDYIVNNLKGLNALLIEANHDVRMLQMGSYPYVLKQRILSNRGHLCNEMCGRLLDEILHNDLEHVFLGHLSQENNYPALAFESVRTEINLSETSNSADEFDISVAHRDRPSKLVEI